MSQHPKHDPNTLQPVALNQRIDYLDQLRGFALLGILLVNMLTFAGPYQYALFADVPASSSPDAFIESLIILFGEGKFYTLFSFLFGLGFMIFVSKAERKGLNSKSYFRRRLVFLLLIGIFHAFFIWMGDILVTYALIGFLLIPFLYKSTKVVISWAIGLWLTSFILFALLTGLNALAESLAETDTDIYATLYHQAIAVYGSGTYGEIFAFRFFELFLAYSNIFISGPMILAMFLLGVYTFKKKLLVGLEQKKELLLKILLISGMVGWPASFLQMAYRDHELLFFFGYWLGGPAICLFYISAFLLLSQTKPFKAILKLFAAPGRMALTNYLAQSLICTFIFYSYGLGLYNQVSATQFILIVPVIFIVQIYWSKLWLKHYQYGPMEWLWRRWTYKLPLAQKNPAAEKSDSQL